MKFTETVEYKKGRIAEEIVKKMLKEVGWKIIDSRDYNGPGAPRISGDEGFIVTLPDLDIAKSGTRKWVEVKYKDRSEYFRKWGRLIHGISIKHFNAYKIIQMETGAPVWLFIYEKKRNNVLCAPLDRLSQPMWHQIYQGENEQDEGGNIYFDINAFNLFGIPPNSGEMFELQDHSWAPSRYIQR